MIFFYSLATHSVLLGPEYRSHHTLNRYNPPVVCASPYVRKLSLSVPASTSKSTSLAILVACSVLLTHAFFRIVLLCFQVLYCLQIHDPSDTISHQDDLLSTVLDLHISSLCEYDFCGWVRGLRGLHLAQGRMQWQVSLRLEIEPPLILRV